MQDGKNLQNSNISSAYLFTAAQLNARLWIHIVCPSAGVVMKDAGMRIRVEPELRDKFVNICRDNDVPAAQVIRTFMREFIQTNTTVKPKSKSRLQPLAKKAASHSRIANTAKRI
jgi:hypothetical protein